jgi:alpha-L-fucosidase 2
MLLQSRNDEIILLPALPQAWPNGSVRGLRARGACTVDLEWRGHQLTRATLVSATGGDYRVHLGTRSITVKLKPGRPLRLPGTRLRAGKDT